MPVITYESERLRSWEREIIELALPGALDWLSNTLPAPGFREWVEAGAPRSEISRVAFLKFVVEGSPFVSTSGGLSRPGDPFYKLLEHECGVKIFHVLVDPPLLTHLRRIWKRRRIRRTSELRCKQQMNKKLTWDAVIQHEEELRSHVNEWLIQDE